MIRRMGRPGLLGTVARTAVVAGTATMTTRAISRRAENRAAEQQEAAAYEQQQAAAHEPDPGQGEADLVEKLRDLVKLRDAGALTEQEFNAAKAKLLA